MGKLHKDYKAAGKGMIQRLAKNLESRTVAIDEAHTMANPEEAREAQLSLHQDEAQTSQFEEGGLEVSGQHQSSKNGIPILDHQYPSDGEPYPAEKSDVANKLDPLPVCLIW